MLRLSNFVASTSSVVRANGVWSCWFVIVMIGVFDFWQCNSRRLLGGAQVYR